MKKLASLIAAGVLLTSAFVSCGDSDDSSESGKAVSDKTTSSAADAENAADEASSEEATTTVTTTKAAVTTKSATTTATVTTKATTKPTGAAVTGRTDGDIVGKWTVDENALGDLMEGMEGMVAKEVYFDFKADGNCLLHASLDFSSLMCIKDEAPTLTEGGENSNELKDKSFFISGYNCPITDFNGRSFKAGMFGSYMTFTREQSSDNIYGEYNIPEEMSDGEDYAEYSKFVFEKSGAAFMVMNYKTTYTYDKNTGVLSGADISGESDGETTVVFVDDDTLVFTKKDGTTVTLKRVK
jgi:hypothetical protein